MNFNGTDLEALPAALGSHMRSSRRFFADRREPPVGLGIRRRGARTLPPRIFELFPVLKEMRHRRGGDLSGGQQQHIGRALVLGPPLILDEPTEDSAEYRP
jgi:ABC-type multidrug transport system ATPase subunit